MVQNSAFKVLTAVITLNKGTLYSITWDDGCHTCFPASCRQNSVLDDGGVTIIQPSDELGAYAGENCFETQSTCSDNPDSMRVPKHQSATEAFYSVWAECFDWEFLQSPNCRCHIQAKRILNQIVPVRLLSVLF